MLDSGIGFALGDMKALGEQLEMMNQAFHVRLHRLTLRRRHLVVVRDHWAWVGLQPCHALPDDVIGLLHLLHAHQVAVIAVAGGTHRHIEVHQAVNLIGLLFAQVPCHTRAAQHRSAKPHIESPLGAHHPDAHGALFPDAVVGQQRVVLPQVLGEALGEVVNEIQQRSLTVAVELSNTPGIANLVGLVLRHGVGQVAVNPARAEIGRMHARAADGFVHVKQVFAFAKGVDQDGRAAAIIAMRAQPHQVVEQARDLGKHHADVLGTQRNLDTQQLFNGQAVGVFVAHHRNII